MEKNYQMPCLECGTLCGRDLNSDKSIQETVRSLRSLDLEKNAKDQLEGQTNSRGRKKHVEYNLAMETHMVRACA